MHQVLDWLPQVPVPVPDVPAGIIPVVYGIHVVPGCPEQIDELLSAPVRVEKSKRAPVWMPARDAAILELFYSSGLRLAELVSLNVEHVDPFTESVRVLGKGRKERVVPVGAPALQAIPFPFA